MNYPHNIVVQRTPVTASSTGGVPVDGTATTVYAGTCDAQDNSKRFDVQAGIVGSKGSATVYVRRGVVLEKGIQTGDSVTITWSQDDTQTGRVESVDRLDDSFVVRYT